MFGKFAAYEGEYANIRLIRSPWPLTPHRNTNCTFVIIAQRALALLLEFQLQNSLQIYTAIFQKFK